MKKLKQASKRLPCYYCGSPCESFEHAPPEMMFAPFRSSCNSITVPSCNVHNTKKAKRDQAVVISLAMLAEQQILHFPNSQSLTDSVKKAIEVLKPQFHQAISLVQPMKIETTATNKIPLHLPFIFKSLKLHSWMCQLTAAIVWSAVGETDSRCDWGEAFAWSPTFHALNSPEELTREDWELDRQANAPIVEGLNGLEWTEGWSAEPRPYPRDIYCFQLRFEPFRCDFKDPFLETILSMKLPPEENTARILVRHQFYNALSVWYVGFRVSNNTVATLANALRT